MVKIYFGLLKTSVIPLDFNLLRISSMSNTNGIVSIKMYDIQDDFNFEIVNFQFLDGDAPHSPSYGVYKNFATYSFCKSFL